MKAVKIGIIGAGGYARFHLKCIHSCEEKGLCSLKAAVIRLPYEPGDAEMEKELVKKGVTIYRDYLRLFAAERGKLDLISVPCGIDQHEKLSVAALEAGFHVLCEKPVAGTLRHPGRGITYADSSRTGRENSGNRFSAHFFTIDTQDKSHYSRKKTGRTAPGKNMRYVAKGHSLLQTQQLGRKDAA